MKKTLLTVVILTTIIGLRAQTPWYITGNNIIPPAFQTCFIGTTNSYPLRFRTNGTDRMFISTTGDVGIGTISPKQMLHVVDGNILISHTATNRAPGSANGSILFGNNASTSYPFGEWGIEYVDADTVGIGTSNPQAKLAVNGEILAKSVRVNISSAYWPDYVFGDGYNLMSLRELEQYMNTHKHLPGIPSAQEVEEQGDVDLGAMNAILLEKVEELTRYVIDLQNQIDELKNGKE